MQDISNMLSYRPRLKATKVKQVEHYIDYTETEFIPSSCYKSIIENKPSFTLSSIKSDISNIKVALNELDLLIVSKHGSGYENSLEALIAENDDIDGDLSFEVYKSIKKDYEALQEVYDIYIESLFGEEEPESYEMALINHLTQLENGEYEDKDKINYTLIAFDSLVSSALISFSSSLSEVTFKFYNSISGLFETDANINGNESMARIFKEKFNRVNEKHIANRNLCSDSLFRQVSLNLIALFEQRDLIEDVQKTYKNLDKNDLSDYITLLMEALTEETNKGFDMIEDLIKNTLLVVVSREEYFNTLSKKQTLSKYYKESV